MSVMLVLMPYVHIPWTKKINIEFYSDILFLIVFPAKNF